MSGRVVSIEGRQLSLSNLDKVLYPSAGFTKARFIDYWRAVAPFALPHLRDRALTLKRYPDGVEGEHFFEKRCPSHSPVWAPTGEYRRDTGEVMTVCLVNDLPTLIWAANLATLEMHVPLARVRSPETPDSVVFDLDPGEGAGLLDCARVALLLRDLLNGLGLASFLKTSGQKGLHVYLPLNRPGVTFEETRAFSRAAAQALERERPELVTSRMSKTERVGKVFINWEQNEGSKTMVCVYSLRATQRPSVSFPLSWGEVVRLAGEGDPEGFRVSPEEAVRRTGEAGDLFAGMLTVTQALPEALSRRSGLSGYAAKRKFAETAEPAPALHSGVGHLAFVIQKHAATALHYDLRLEMGGVLKSWACPKGPSLDPAVKRLAVMVEDHPYDYKDFEGVIPEGNYGAGGVIIWDRGFYRHPAAVDGKGEELLLEGLAKGDVKFVLEGEKLKGEFALARMARDPTSWLLIKKRDAHAGGGEVLAQNRSVSSGRTLEELLAGAPAGREAARVALREALESVGNAHAPRTPMPAGVRPMLASVGSGPFDHPEWVFEVKWDGYRAIAEVRGGKAALGSRNLLDLGGKFPPVARALEELRFEAVLDGEIVAVDERGFPDFQLLQDYGRSGRGFLLYSVFDLIHLEGRDLTGLPLLKRKELLGKILPSSPVVRYCDHIAGEGVRFFEVATGRGLEGIIAKHGASLYRPGERSREWLKIKARRTADCVIAGFTASRARGRPFGTLVLGVYRGNELLFAGHSGDGFSEAELREIRGRLDPLVREECPFRVVPQTNAPTTWVAPELVCEVEFTGWTAQGLMRHPVFLRLREDKDPREAVREESGP